MLHLKKQALHKHRCLEPDIYSQRKGPTRLSAGQPRGRVQPAASSLAKDRKTWSEHLPLCVEQRTTQDWCLRSRESTDLL